MINISHAGEVSVSTLKAVTGSLILLEAYEFEWSRVTRDLTEVQAQAAGDLAVSVLKGAMDKVNTRSDQRATLTLLFCKQWNLSMPAEAHRLTEPVGMGSRMHCAG